MLIGDTEKSLEELERLHEAQGRRDKFYHYFLGRIYMSRYQFDEAIQSWKTFLGSRASKSDIIKEETRNFLEEAENFLKFFDNTDNYEIHQLGGHINSEGAELTPAYFTEKDELLFASSRGSAGNESFKVYHAIKQDDGWTHLSEIDILGEFTRETANIEVVDEDGKLFMFSPKSGGSLYYSETRNGKWIKPVQFDSKVSSTHLKSHFFINEHEDRIIFATDKNAKTHGLDIYESYRNAETGKWSKPAPFHSAINSEYDEDSPYLTHDEKTMYFSSNRFESVGGFDIYVSYFNEDSASWSTPKNMGFPINSPGDEMHFKINPDNKSGYFSSNRVHTKGDFDIFFFWEIEKINIEGRVYDAAAKEAVTDAMVRFTPSSYTDEHFRAQSDEKGKYRTKIISEETYLIEVIKEGKTLFTDQFEIHETGGLATTYIKNIIIGGAPASQPTEPVVTSPPPPAKEETPKSTPVSKEDPPVVEKPKPEPITRKPAVSSNIQKLADYSVGDKVIIHNIYFDFGTAGLSRNATTVLNELYDVLEANPRIRVEISGHTDNVGSAEANAWISENRAKTVRKWLVNQGIPANRLVAKGYGETQPLASNDDEVGGRELNRRIEVRIIN